MTEGSSMRSQLAFCISKLLKGDIIQIGGLGMMVNKVIMMTEILKERIGWLHQVNKFTTHSAYPRGYNTENKNESRRQM